jgi:hypothetical protein
VWEDSGLQGRCAVAGLLIPDVSKEATAFIFDVCDILFTKKLRAD